MFKLKALKTKEECEMNLENLSRLVKDSRLSPEDLITVYRQDILMAVGEVSFWERVGEGTVEHWTNIVNYLEK